MTARTLQALKGSIEKWERIVAGTGGDRGYRNCPLCALFLRYSEPTCEGCPVAAKSGRPNCEKTPYIAWHESGDRSYEAIDKSWFAHGPKSLAAAKRELAFLKSLLPKEAKR